MSRSKKEPNRSPADGTSRGETDARLSSDLQAHIGVRLKALYDSVLSEPIPDRFAELLQRLDGPAEAPVARNGNGSAVPTDGGRPDSEPDANAARASDGADTDAPR
ncbi:NepR family anti-sigma factor [Oharaeibacter diazotrophicus]|uniref:Anti-sigma factor NepR domain-containing protein n=1 Tax=Oharaeibacter diazotrophicus TaxID=1920512 RepID=A0A4R6RD05_9HYPH|nr:NepR family anti-sigma factor [Oharaeibacter diazotrophicus]TDP83576.1 hypothetical protein EDD54_3538 [Oharaeibacter diazotrophicus]BBE72409.1 hypothetical protein OHA_1_01999 [Pleomorphomonas sp. SM30]GLS79179.1 hypothetical protein GCM10007904_45160 [Oharaeibacter diazotrophicus]